MKQEFQESLIEGNNIIQINLNEDLNYLQVFCKVLVKFFVKLPISQATFKRAV